MSDDGSDLFKATLDAIHTRLDQMQAALDDLNRYRALFVHLGWVKLMLSSLTAGMAGFWTPVLAVMAVVEPPIPSVAWLIGLGGGCIALAQDLRSQLELPPVGNNAQLAARLQKPGAP